MKYFSQSGKSTCTGIDSQRVNSFDYFSVILQAFTKIKLICSGDFLDVKDCVFHWLLSKIL